ncbi:uncharacterized protein [Mytilus edulis]|uniref:uncharacterized protein isoform X2 n=1 Tax=Mytilus edulis TaxID=6550 RepID=UPI0039EF92DC
MAEDQDDEDGEIEIPVEQQYVTDNSVPDQFNPNQNAQPNSVFDRNNYVQIDELPLTETLMGRGYPEQWKNFATQDSSTMTDFKKPHGRKKGIVSNYPMSDRTYERGPKVSGDTTPGNVNNNNFNRRIPDGTIVESYQISALDRTNTYKDIHNSNNSASSRHSKSGANYDLRPISDRNFQEQFHRKLKKGELRETNTILRLQRIVIEAVVVSQFHQLFLINILRGSADKDTTDDKPGSSGRKMFWRTISATVKNY